MTSIYWSYLISCTLPGLAGHDSALGRIRIGLDVDPLNFSDRKPSNSRLGPAKVPPPGVALVNMTAPAGSLPLTVSTPKLIRLFRPRCVFVRNRRCGVSIKKALKEWHPSKTVPNSANLVSWDRRGFANLSNAIYLHGARGLKVKILKSTENNQGIQTKLFLENAIY